MIDSKLVSIHAPLRGATRGADFIDIVAWRVSIHAPLRGATCEIDKFARQTYVSIHAPLRGATAAGRMVFGFDDCFNPRTPAGCDAKQHEHAPFVDVSIHAPLRGATLPKPKTCGSCTFQSTHPCGVRRDFRLQIGVVVGVSIHAPLRGATIKPLIYVTTAQ